MIVTAEVMAGSTVTKKQVTVDAFATSNQITRAVKDAHGWKGKPCKKRDTETGFKLVAEDGSESVMYVSYR